MDNKYLNFIENMFDSKETPSQEQMMQLMEETLSFFRDVRGRLTSEDEEEKAKAMAEIAEVREKLESKMKGIAEKSGLDPSQLASMASQMMGSQYHQTTAKVANLGAFPAGPKI